MTCPNNRNTMIFEIESRSRDYDNGRGEMNKNKQEGKKGCLDVQLDRAAINDAGNPSTGIDNA